MQAPIGDPEWAIWTIGPGGKDNHNWDVLYEVHHIWPEDFAEYLDDLSKVALPQRVVTLEPAQERIFKWVESHANGDPVKRQELHSKITGSWEGAATVNKQAVWDVFLRRMWFSSSISYCLADAIIRLRDVAMNGGKPVIGLWGIDLEAGEEYISQYVGAAHMIDMARHFGVDVMMPPGCGLDRDVSPYPDRYETHFALATEKKVNWLQSMIPQVEFQLEDIKANYYRQEGALANMRDMSVAEDAISRATQNLQALDMRMHQVQGNLQTLRGELSACEYWRRMYVFEPRDP